VFARLIDAARRQLVGLDALLIGTVARLFRRPREDSVIDTGTVTGRTAGGVSRLAAFLVDMTVISFSSTVTVALISYLVGLFTGHTVDTSNGSMLAIVGYLLFAFKEMGTSSSPCTSSFHLTSVEPGRLCGRRCVPFCRVPL
jgi:hypothetical protein